MARSKCTIICCVAVVVCNQIGGGLFLIALTLLFVKGMNLAGLMILILGFLVYMASGALLVSAAIKRKPVLIVFHFIITVTSLFIHIIGWVILFMVMKVGDVINYFFVAVAFFVMILFLIPCEYIVLEFYNRMKSESPPPPPAATQS